MRRYHLREHFWGVGEDNKLELINYERTLNGQSRLNIYQLVTGFL